MLNYNNLNGMESKVHAARAHKNGHQRNRTWFWSWHIYT